MTEEGNLSNVRAGEFFKDNANCSDKANAIAEPRTMTVTMLAQWPPGKCVWLRPGETHTLDYELARLLLVQRKAEFTGGAHELFKI